MQRVRKQAALRVVERETGFVAGAFDAENEHDSRAEGRGNMRLNGCPLGLARMFRRPKK
jgi:hypothetical protein